MKTIDTLDRHHARDADDIIDSLGELNQRFAGKRILITGAAGFLGSQFVYYFLRANENTLSQPCEVIAWDNFMRGKPEWVKALQSMRPDVKFLTKDIIKDTDYGEVDFVIHGATIASPTFYRKYPLATIDANIQGLRNLLDYAVNNQRLESLLFFSTSEIYGDPDPANIPTKETYRGHVSCTGPRACYDESKRFGETLCVTFHQEFSVPVKIARPFNNYGPGLKITDKRVLPDFFRDVLNGQAIKLLSDGKATRTFCYVSDAVTGYLRILLSTHHAEPFNIGTDQPEISMLELAQEVMRISGLEAPVEYVKSSESDYLTDNPQRRCPDISKARQLLNYEPRVGLREGLLRNYEYYKDHQNAVEG
jgi:UDP-glucuronate decarboxylase